MTRELLQEASRRALATADNIFPARFKPDAPHLLQVVVGMLARCLTTAESCLHLSELDRRTDLMIAVRTLYEHMVTLAWLTGSDQGEHRMMLLQRHNDEQALRIDHELVAAGGESSISEESRTVMADAAAALGTARMPSLADRAVQADNEWRHRLAVSPNDEFPWSFRGMYTGFYRPASAMAHPTWAGVRMVIERSDAGIVIDRETTGLGADALQPVPALLALALLISTHTLGKPDAKEVGQFASWFARASEAPERPPQTS